MPRAVVFGFPIPKVAQVIGRPRLVVNEGTPDELISPVRAWRTAPVEVSFVWADKDLPEGSTIEPKGEEVTADHPEIEVEPVSEEWYRRFEEASETQPAESRAVGWEALSAPARTRAGSSVAEDGFFETVLETGTATGQERRVVAKLRDVVLGTTDPLVVEAGAASQTQSQLTAASLIIPADGARTTLLTLEAKDPYGNRVADGTTVAWEKAEDTDGELLEAQEAIQDGKATVKYRAGASHGVRTVRAATM